MFTKKLTISSLGLIAFLSMSSAHSYSFGKDNLKDPSKIGGNNPIYTTVYRKLQTDFDGNYQGSKDTQFSRTKYSYRSYNAILLKQTYHPQYDGEQVFTSHYNNDGKVIKEVSEDQTHTVEYDSMGRQQSYTIDHVLNEHDKTLYFTYDSYGNENSTSYDFGNDGSINREFTWTFNSYKHPLNTTIKQEGIVIYDVSNIYTYTLDDNDNVIYQTTDRFADGTINYLLANSYDWRGNMLSTSYDSDADGNPNHAADYTYDYNNRMLSYNYDSDGDGTPNQLARFIYNFHGNIIFKYVDSNGDGIEDATHTFNYDSRQNLIRQTFVSLNGEPTRVTRHTWGAFRVLRFR